MTTLPITHMTLYKHGVGYFRRRGPVEGKAVKLTFRREEMDDMLKSLTVIDHASGQVQGVDYDTPQSQAERLAGCSVILDNERSLRDLLQVLRGRAVTLLVKDAPALTGILLGLDEAENRATELPTVTILQADSQTVAVINLNQLVGVDIQDETASADLRFFLQTALGQETHRSITIRLSAGEHDLEVSYIAPAPTWRVSYRLVADEGQTEALLQGWGIFDNRLEEDLTDISLSLTAGMPISFMYDLYTPHTPTRPTVAQEERTAAAPIMFDAAVMAEETDSFGLAGVAPAAPMMMAAPMPKRAMSSSGMRQSVSSAATGKAMGELFQYNVSAPVTVGRGQSAMVPIVSTMLNFKKDLIYNGQKMATHPIATMRFNNRTDLTLERGPVTVMEAGEYVGEAVLPFTTNEAEAVISYAVELGVHVKEELQTESRLESLQLQNAYLWQNFYDIRRTTYHVDNRTAQAKKVLIEHNRSGSYQLFDMAEPTEKTLDTYRYEVSAAAGKITNFMVQERYSRASRAEIRNLSYQNLQQYFNDKFLDDQAYRELKGLLDLWAEISNLEKEIVTQEQQRGKIYQMQEQAQKNMVVLAKEGEEGALRSRYVQQISQSEEELTKIKNEISRMQAEIKRKQQQIEQWLARLGK